MAAVSSELRGILEKAVLAGRAASETAAAAALNTIGLTTVQPYASLTAEQRRLRVALRARARQLGDGSEEKGRHLLVEEIAYEQWHRMLFARFLAENGLLIYPGSEGVAVTLDECAELAPEEGEPDAWSLAARYASAMLPGIFRVDDPASQVRFAPEGRAALETIIAGLPQPVFLADDSLGWVYQFWQSKAKDEVNKSGKKIGAEELPAVTQLFTEDYMVRFLLENSLGAWWAGKHTASPLLKDFEYLRYKDDGTPAAGTFPGWPERVAEVTVMDPCCGSGHFLVAVFDMLRRMRMEEEGLSESGAGDAVLHANVHGLEIDPRCTQIAAFALAFAAWKSGGYRRLPPLNIACSGIPVKGQLEEWSNLAGDNVNLRLTLERLYHLFREAPTLGSLVNPVEAREARDPLFALGYTQIEPVLQKALAAEVEGDPGTGVFGAAAQGVVRAAALLVHRYTLVATNVPYLGRGKQSQALTAYCDLHYPLTKADLATVFLERCIELCSPNGAAAIVTPQNWLFLGAYTKMRERILRQYELHALVRLGPGAFETITGEVVKSALTCLSDCGARKEHRVQALDLSCVLGAALKARALSNEPLVSFQQSLQVRNPDARIVLEDLPQGILLSQYAEGLQGTSPADTGRLTRKFWEHRALPLGWRFFQSSVRATVNFGGKEDTLDLRTLEDNIEVLGAAIRGRPAWSRWAVSVSKMNNLPVTLTAGEPFDANAHVVLPRRPEHLPAIWAFCKSRHYREAVRKLDQKLDVTNATIVKVPFDLEYWQKVAEEAGPLPEPCSDEPTQWLFKGDPADSAEPLQVAAGRLLGYRWPDQQPDQLDSHADEDGFVCLPPIAGEQSAAERLRSLLTAAYGDEWSPSKQGQLLTQVGYQGKDLQEWLRDDFFPQHCKLFHNRPFIWHIWDGRKDGFSVLVNYHKLDAAGLNRLIYTYLGSWIETQRTAQTAGEPGADGRLVAALELQRKLQLIAEGEPPYDIYARWKPLHEQPIGWKPDLNDGVRLNIRPFVEAKVLRSKFTINWNKDRGTNPDGSERLNDLHRAIAEKRAAREAAGVR